MKSKLLGATLLASQAVFAASSSGFASGVNSQLIALVEMLRSIVPVIALGLFVFAGIVYAIGQVFDVQTRQKAQAWAMAMIVGGIIGVIIVLISPWLIDFLLGFSS